MNELKDFLGDLLKSSLGQHDPQTCTCDGCTEQLIELIGFVRARGEEPTVDTLMKVNREIAMDAFEKRMSIQINFGIASLGGMLTADLEALLVLVKKYKYQISCRNDEIRFITEETFNKRMILEKKVFNERILKVMQGMNKKKRAKE